MYSTILHRDSAFMSLWTNSKAAARFKYKSSTVWLWCVLCYCNKLRTEFTKWTSTWRDSVYRKCADSQNSGVTYMKCVVNMYWQCSSKMVLACARARAHTHTHTHTHTHIFIKKCTKICKNGYQNWQCNCSEHKSYSAGALVLNTNLSHRILGNC